MKRTFLLSCALTLLCIAPHTAAGNLSFQHTFENSFLTIVSENIDGISYTKAIYKDAMQGGNIGEPSYPICHYSYTIPQRVQVLNMTHKATQGKATVLPYHLMPLQDPIPTGLMPMQPQMVYSSTAYTQDAYFPTDNIVHYTVSYERETTIISFDISPIRYNPRSKQLVFCSNVTIDIQTAPVPTATRQSRTTTSTPNPSATTSELPYYEYVIVTSKKLIPAFETFTNWKRAKGYNVGIVDIADICNNQSIRGDEKSQIYDDAGKLRQYLTNSYNAVGTKYVLLGGDHTVVPIRYGTGLRNNTKPSEQIPTDTYFADIDGDWEVDGDGLYGEPKDDAVDFGAEMYVGRLLCTSPEDIHNWTRKVLQYEINPGEGDYAYLTRALFTEADQMQDDRQAERIDVAWNFFNSTILREQPSTRDSFPTAPTGQEVIERINNIHYGLMSSFNHGGANSYGVATRTHNGAASPDTFIVDGMHRSAYVVSAYEQYTRWNVIPENKNGFDNLTNTLYPMIMYSTSCTNMPFDDYESDGYDKNLGAMFTCGSTGGGPAYLGNTRAGYVYPSFTLYQQFVPLVLDENTNHLGQAEALSLNRISHYDHQVPFTHNLVGCPEMPMWTSIPQQFDALSIETLDNGVSVQTNEEAKNIRICLSGIVNGEFKQWVYTDIANAEFREIPDEYVIVVTKPNYLPAIIQYPDCNLQNIQIVESRHYDACEKTQIGSDVSFLKPQGSVVIQQGGYLEIQGGEVTIKNGFEVKQGGELYIH